LTFVPRIHFIMLQWKCFVNTIILSCSWFTEAEPLYRSGNRGSESVGVERYILTLRLGCSIFPSIYVTLWNTR